MKSFFKFEAIGSISVSEVKSRRQESFQLTISRSESDQPWQWSSSSQVWNRLQRTMFAIPPLRFWEEICGKDLDVKILRQNKNDRYCIVNIDGEPVNDKLLRDGVLRVHEGRQMREEPAYVPYVNLSTCFQTRKRVRLGKMFCTDCGSGQLLFFLTSKIPCLALSSRKKLFSLLHSVISEPQILFIGLRTGIFHGWWNGWPRSQKTSTKSLGDLYTSR